MKKPYLLLFSLHSCSASKRICLVPQVTTLIYLAGALLVLMSMAGWVLWYSGNIEGLTSKKELGHISSAVDRLARNLSRKIRTYRGHH